MSDSPRNLLADEDSPYLLQHAGNPVAWQPWGEAAFARARRENKPVFLSIGYSTCHWCHVMEHESFENPAVAEVLNRHFVSIKVDREERPDVDLTYMTYVQAVTGHGGWPMTVFLTPEGEPIFGGTYFPPDDRHGRTGFLQLITRIQELWATRPDELRSGARSALEQLRASEDGAARAAEPVPDAVELARAAVAVFGRQFDRAHAGFGGAPKFPRPAAPFLLLEIARRWPAESFGVEARVMAMATLQAMADGGIHDHLGGGFHRYAVDRIWHIPHYEKMLYDQAQIAPLYLEAARQSGNPAFAAVATGIFEYVSRDLSHPGGGFFSAEDADSLPTAGAPAKKEGAFYVFTAEEIQQSLEPEAALLFATAYGVTADGNVDPNSDPHGELAGTNTFFRAAGLATLAERFNRPADEIRTLLQNALATMLAVRNQRPRPHRDEKIVAGWNGLMIGALATGARLLGRVDWRDRAEQAAAHVRQNLWDETNGVLYRSFRARPARTRAFAIDYVQMISGLLDLQAAGGSTRWVDWAVALQAALDRNHRDEADGCYFSARADGDLGVLSLKDDHDGAEASPNSLGALNLIRLARLTGNTDYEAAAARILASQSASLESAPHVAPVLAAAAIRGSRDAGMVVVAPCDHAEAAPLIEVVQRLAPPDVAIILLPGDGPERAWWVERHPWMAGLPDAAAARPSVHYCRDQSCGLPLTSAAGIEAAMREGTQPGPPSP